MTYSEDLQICLNSESYFDNFGNVLKVELKKAQQEGRLIIGIYECALVLQNTPEEVDLCLLPDITETEDVESSLIHQKLVDAFCWENDIDVIKVAGFNELECMLEKKKETNKNNTGCILICTKDKMEEASSDNYFTMLANQFSTIKMPDWTSPYNNEFQET